MHHIKTHTRIKLTALFANIGFDPAEIAEILELSERQVQQGLRRAKERSLLINLPNPSTRVQQLIKLEVAAHNRSVPDAPPWVWVTARHMVLRVLGIDPTPKALEPDGLLVASLLTEAVIMSGKINELTKQLNAQQVELNNLRRTIADEEDEPQPTTYVPKY